MRYLFYILMSLLLSPAISRATDSIRLHAQVNLSDSQVRLGQIAHVSVADAELREQLSELLLVESPSGRIGEWVSLEQVETTLRLAGHSPLRFNIFGATRCRVMLAGSKPSGRNTALSEVPVSGASLGGTSQETVEIPHAADEVFMLADQLTQWVALQLKLDPARLTAQWQCYSRPEVLTEPYDPIRHLFEPRSAAGLGKVYFNLIDMSPADSSGQTDRASNRKHVIRGTVYYLSEVVVARRDLSPGEVVGQDDIEVRPVRLDRIQGGQVLEVDQVVGQEVARAVRAGMPVESRMLRRIVMVKRNDIVDVEYRSGAIVMRLKARARQAGGKGDEIVLQDVINRSTLVGTVVDHRKVQIAQSSGATVARSDGGSQVQIGGTL